MLRARRILLLVSALLITANGAVDLPLNDINVVVTTDVHSWVAGRRRNETDADYGDVVSFVERLRAMEPSKDVFFVMNGDSIHGTGLSTDPPKAMVSILERIPFDAVTVGEHELSNTETVEFLTKIGGYVQFMGEKYVTSNVILKETNSSMGVRYSLMKGSKSTILTFGFLYDGVDLHRISPLVEVEDVATVVGQDWFKNTLTEEQYDGIVVLAHIDVESPLIGTIRKAVRRHAGALVPIQFMAGHSHRRDKKKFEGASYAMEAGHYFDTLGFASFPKKSNKRTNVKFEHQFLDTSVPSLANRLGLGPDELATKNGKALSDFIQRTRVHLRLDEFVGCSPRTFKVDAPLEADNSLWGLYKKEIVPRKFDFDVRPTVIFQRKDGAFVYDLARGNLTVDDVLSTVPRNESFHLVAKQVPGLVVSSLNDTLNKDSLEYILIGVVDTDSDFDVYSVSSDLVELAHALIDLLHEPSKLMSVPFDVTVEELMLSYIREEWPNCTTFWEEEDLEEDLHHHDWRASQLRKIRGAIGGSIAVALTIFFIVVLRLRDRYYAAQGRLHDYDEDTELVLQNEDAKIE